MKRLMCLSCILLFVAIMCGSVAFAANSNGKLSTTWGEIRGASTIKLAPSATQTRPIEEFVEAQGTYIPPIPIPPESDCWVDTMTTRVAMIDWAGLHNTWIVNNGGTSLGTEMDGTVTEQPLKDGRAEVRVMLHTKNALTFVLTGWGPDFNYDSAPLLFGHQESAVLTGADPALGESFFQITFINTAPGAPLPDLVQLFWFPEDGQEMRFLSFRSHSGGTLREAFGVPDGTPGKAIVVQIGLLKKAFNPKSAVADAFPAENIILNVTGK